jgi:2-C-methyl-D-erythritol 2,4-cyclodiphosphate synthase
MSNRIRTRSGIGYDVHRLVEGRKLILGGVEIPYEKGLEGHSDADVLSHAIADAVLGAMGEPDIGYYFPPDDESIEGICSLDILAKVAEIAADKGAVIVNVDSTMIAEAPKILPHASLMRENIARALQIDPDQVGIKATTNERMGFAGRGEGMAAMAVAAVEMGSCDR